MQIRELMRLRVGEMLEIVGSGDTDTGTDRVI